MCPTDPRKSSDNRVEKAVSASEANKKAITALSTTLPELIRSQAGARVKEDLVSYRDELDNLKDYFAGMEKTTTELLKWRNAGLVCHRDEVIAIKWANSVLELTNADNQASFERLIATCMWAVEAFNTAARKENVKKFLSKFLT